MLRHSIKTLKYVNSRLKEDRVRGGNNPFFKNSSKNLNYMFQDNFIKKKNKISIDTKNISIKLKNFEILI